VHNLFSEHDNNTYLLHIIVQVKYFGVEGEMTHVLRGICLLVARLLFTWNTFLDFFSHRLFSQQSVLLVSVVMKLN
jgi:hypothetical protein